MNQEHGLSLRVELNKKISRMFELIKDYYGFESHSDAIRFLITEKYREILKQKSKEAKIKEGVPTKGAPFEEDHPEDS